MSKKERITISINAETKFNLKLMALKRGKTMSEMIEPEIEKYVNEHKEYLD